MGLRVIVALGLWAVFGLGVQAEPSAAKTWGLYEFTGWPTPQPVDLWIATEDLERGWAGGKALRQISTLTPIEYDETGLVKRWAVSDNEVDCDAKGYRSRGVESFTADGKREATSGDDELIVPPAFAPVSLLVEVACGEAWRARDVMPTVDAAVADSSRRMQLYKAKQKADRDRSY